MDDVVRNMHTRSGLLADIEASTPDRWPRPAPRRSRSCRSTSTSRAPSRWPATPSGPTGASWPRSLPEVEDYLHYRSVDVSTIKELCRRWRPEVYKAAPTKKGGHRALQDIRESVGELAYYRAAHLRPHRSGADHTEGTRTEEEST